MAGETRETSPTTGGVLTLVPNIEVVVGVGAESRVRQERCSCTCGLSRLFIWLSAIVLKGGKIVNLAPPASRASSPLT